MTARRILVLGASGLIGHAIATDLKRRGHVVTAAARHFTPAQRVQFGIAAHEMPLSALNAGQWDSLLRDIDLVVNCVGLLQDQPGNTTQNAHEGFVGRLLAAIKAQGRPILLVHLSIPGNDSDDHTGFSLTKRNADRAIAASGLPYAVLRPGFVFAPAAYGGSALMRAFAALPFDLPAREAGSAFAAVAVEDVAATVAHLAQSWTPGAPHAVTWDLVHPQTHTVASVIASLRRWIGDVWPIKFPMPRWMLDLGARAGDVASHLGWSPPIRSTALAEMRRGVTGDPRAWLDATGIEPRSLDDLLSGHPATVQDKWFARLFMMKAVIVASLVVFWCVSGLIALTFAYPAAVAILTTHGFSAPAAHVMTVVSSLIDISVGLTIASRRTHRIGLVAGILVSLGYMGGSTIITPDLWIEPLGALVKTGPAIVLMLVALCISDNR